MRRCKSGKRFGFHILGVLALMLVFCFPVSAGVQEAEGEYEIYPTPQSVEYGTGAVTLTDKVNVVIGDTVDSYTKTRISETLKVLGLEQNTAAAAGSTNLIVGVYGTDDAADAYGDAHGVNAAVYEKYDAYTLWIKENDIVILGQDTDAAYYGVTTLKRIFEQLEGRSVKELTVEDYAEVEFRGFIEGYYGNPWSHEDRVDLMKFGGEIKMNQYIYAPKDDPLHNARWRELYDEEGLKKVSELAQAGNESKCFFVYALHMFQNNPLTEANYDRDLQVAKDKFSQVIEAGVRQIAILEDDAGENGWTTETLIRLLNDMSEWLQEMKKTYPDLKTDLLFCPGYMVYADSMTGGSGTTKINSIHAGVPDNVRIVMTGGKVWGDLTTDFADRFYSQTDSTGKEGRYPYMWINWPCNDNTKTSTIMGGHNYILHAGIDPSKFEGVVLNPMQESEPSKVGIFTAADFCWKVWQSEDEGDQAWDDAFKYIDHMTPVESEESNALREVAKHMITQGPNQITSGKQAQFDESVEVKDEITAFTAKMNTNAVQDGDVASLREEFVKMNDAVNLYMEQGTNKRLISQMTPFMSCFRDMTQADICLLDAMAAELSGDSSSIWDNYAEAQTLYEKSHTYGFDYYGSGTIYAEAARKYITPFTEDALKYVSDKVKALVDPEHKGENVYSGALSYTDGWSVYSGSGNMTDGDDATDTWFNNGSGSAVGEFVQLDIGSAQKIGRVRILAGTSGSQDKWTKYHLEYSADGQEWERLESHTGLSTGIDTYEVNLDGASARYVKLVNDAATSNWVRFSEFSVYSYVEEAESKQEVYTNTEDAGWEAEFGDDTFEILPKEDAALQPGEYIGLKLDRIHEIKDITVLGTGTDSLVLETAMNPGEWTADQAAARYIRLVNTGSETVNFSLTSFVVETNEIFPMDLLETNIGNIDSGQDARSLGTTRNWVDGDLTTAAKYCAQPQAGSYVIYDLGQEIDIRSLKIWTRTGTYDYPRDAKIQVSLTSGENAQWEDILEIGDGASDGSSTFTLSPEENGWTPGTGAVEVAYAYREAAVEEPVKARYIRLYFTADNGGRWVELYEIGINDGEQFPTAIDPTYETDAAYSKGYEPQNLNDGDLTTAFKPEGTEGGSLIYHLSTERPVGRLNILQSGSSISNATVSARTDADTWVELGKLDRSFSAFYTADLGNVYDVKLEWKDTAPVIYEIIALENPGDVLEKNLADANKDLKAADEEAAAAAEAVEAINTQVADAVSKVNAAANAADKLKAEIALQKLYAERSAAEAAEAEKKAEAARAAAAVAQVEARNLRVQAANAATEAEKKQLEDAASDKDTEASNKLEEALNQQKIVTEKQDEQTAYEKAAEDKQKELDNLQQKPDDTGKPIPQPTPQPTPSPQPTQPEITSFNYKNVKYKVLDASAKTAAAVGVTTKKVKSVTVYNTVKSGGTTWKIVQINANAFKGCKKLAKATIGANVKKIGSQAFANCTRLKTVNMKKAAKITSIGKKAFTKINAKAKITVPAKKRSKYKKLLKKAGVPKTASIK